MQIEKCRFNENTMKLSKAILVFIIFNFIFSSCNFNSERRKSIEHQVYDYDNRFLILNKNEFEELCSSQLSKNGSFSFKDLISQLSSGIKTDYENLSKNLIHDLEALTKQSLLDSQAVNELYAIKLNQLNNLDVEHLDGEDVQLFTIEWIKRNSDAVNKNAWFLGSDYLFSYNFQEKYLADFSSKLNAKSDNPTIFRTVNLIPEKFNQIHEHFPQQDQFYIIDSNYLKQIFSHISSSHESESYFGEKLEVEFWKGVSDIISRDSAVIIVFGN